MEKNETYKQLLEKALPYYEQGRPMDVEHIKWLYKTVPQFVSQGELDHTILMPLVVLHDVGYSKIPKGSDSYNLDIRKAHSEYGAEIARALLTEMNYAKQSIDEVCRLVLKHDNWAFGDSFVDEPYLLAFNNFDFMWMATEKGFKMCREGFKGRPSPTEFYHIVEKFQQANIDRGSRWFNEKIRTHYVQLMNERKKEYHIEG